MRWLLFAAVAGCRFSRGEPIEETLDDAGNVVPDAPADASIDAPDAQRPPPSNIIEAESFTQKTPSATRAWTPSAAIAGFSGLEYMQCTPGTGNACPNDANLDTCAASMDYALEIAVDGTYFVHVRVTADSGSTDSAYYGIDNAAAPDAIPFPQNSQWEWRTGETTFMLPAGAHKLTIWQRECGANVDVVAVTDSAVPPP